MVRTLVLIFKKKEDSRSIDDDFLVLRIHAAPPHSRGWPFSINQLHAAVDKVFPMLQHINRI